MADLLEVSLIEMIVEVERDLLAKRRSWHAKQATGRLPAATAERRLRVLTALREHLRCEASPAELAHLEEVAARKREKQAARAARKLGAHPPPP